MKTVKQIAIQIKWCITVLFIPFVMHAQNTVSIATTSGTINLAFIAPTHAGNPLLAITDNSNWLNYHIAANTIKYSISAQLQSALPNGFQLQVLAGPYQGTWGGSVAVPNRRGLNYTDNAAGDSPGIPATVVTLTLLPQVIVSNIGTFDTGTGAYLGHQLTYTMRISDYSTVRTASSNVSVLYTVTQP
ncbi:MAG: hypothetical protein WCJ95_03405 [Mariniphaga sp.]